VISISKKNATWFPCEETKTVSIIIDQSRWGFSIKKETPFSMDIQLDDNDCPPCTCNGTQCCEQGYPYGFDQYALAYGKSCYDQKCAIKKKLNFKTFFITK